MRSSARGGQRRAPGVLKCGPWPVAHVLIYGAGKVRRSLNRFLEIWLLTIARRTRPVAVLRLSGRSLQCYVHAHLRRIPRLDEYGLAHLAGPVRSKIANPCKFIPSRFQTTSIITSLDVSDHADRQLDGTTSRYPSTRGPRAFSVYIALHRVDTRTP